MPRKTRIDMRGLRYGRLIGVEYAGTSRGGRAQWLFECDCGGEVVADGGNVRSGGTTSCGCYHREISAERLTVHGHRAGRRHGPTYRAWQTMCSGRCGKVLGAMSGGGRRTVFEGWRCDYAAFLRDVGERPVDAVLSLIDPDEGYAPGNCAWTVRTSRRDRALAGWAAQTRLDPSIGRDDQVAAASAPTSQSRSSPAPACIMALSIAR